MKKKNWEESLPVKKVVIRHYLKLSAVQLEEMLLMVYIYIYHSKSEVADKIILSCVNLVTDGN